MSLIPELEPPEHMKRALAAQAKMSFDPECFCHACPLTTSGSKTRPVLPIGAEPVLAVVGDAPVDRFGRGVVMDAIAAAGIDVARVAWVPLARCRPADGDFQGPAWGAALRQCWGYFEADTAGTYPLLLLGAGPTLAFLGGRTRVGAARGLWAQAQLDSRDVFVVRNPEHSLSVQDPGARDALLAELRADISNMADHLLGREVELPFEIQVFDTPAAAGDFLLWLGEHPGPWAFDIEAFDAKEFPSRKSVSLDPCHPDFRMRGVAFAWAYDKCAYVDVGSLPPEQVRPYLDLAFGSPAEKWAFNGHFDEEGIVYPGYASVVRNRGGDGMLAMLSLSDGRHESLRLEYAVVNILGERQYWSGMDKSKMRDIPLRTVGRNAGGDAVHTLRLCDYLHGRLERGEYF
jgi:hypothetical protein